jgi:hypothetical protein
MANTRHVTSTFARVTCCPGHRLAVAVKNPSLCSTSERARCVEARSADTVVDDLIEKASSALANARGALAEVQRDADEHSNTAVPAFIPSTLTFGAPLSEQTKRPDTDADAPTGGGAVPLPQGSSSSTSSAAANPPPAPPPQQGEQHWGDTIDEAPTMILQRQAVRPARQKPLAFAEPNPVMELTLPTQVQPPPR